MTLVEETLNKAVRDIVNAIISPNFAIKAKQNAPRPTTSYASVDTMISSSVGIEELKMTDRIIDPDIDSRRTGYREVMFSLQFYRDNAFDNATLTKIGFTRNSILETLRAADLGLATRSEVRDISEQLENGWEERAQFDLVLSAIGTDNDIITSIENVVMDGGFQTRGKIIPVTVEV